MKRINEWLAREAARQARHPRLEHALLTDRASGYVWYRLRLMWLRVFVRCAVHVLEIMLLSSAMVPQEWLAVFIGYRTSTGLLSSLYWGVLEQMRQKVREHVQHRHIGSARLEIHNWLRLSLIAGVLGVSAIIAWIAFAPSLYSGLSLFDLFGIACVARLAFDLWARALHSGIFATRRVYRPLWSLLLPEIVELALLIVIFPRFGLLAFLAMVVGGGVVRIGLSNHFSKRAYRGSRIDVPSFTEALVARNVLTGADLGAAAKLGLSNATSQLDGLIIMLLLFAGSSGAGEGDGVTFASVYYVLRPLMGVAHGWARAFYFDFNRLDSGVELFQRRFRALLTRTAVVLAGVVAVLVLLVTALLSGGMPSASLVCLVPFFVARSLMSVRQLEAFTSGQHAALLRVSTGVVGVLSLIAWLTRSEVVVMLAASALMLLAYRLLATRTLQPVTGLVSGLPRFVARLHRETTPLRLSVLTIDRDVTTASRLIHRLSTVIEQGSIARFGRSHVLVLEPANASKLSSARDAALIGQGTLAAYRSVQGDNGDAALQQAIDRKVLPAELAQMLNSDANMNIVDAYKAAHPSGTVIDAMRGSVASGQTLKPRELRAVMHAIQIQARGGIERSSNKLHVMVYAPGGEPQTIFITPLDNRDQRPSIQLRKQIQTATLRASLHLKA